MRQSVRHAVHPSVQLAVCQLALAQQPVACQLVQRLAVHLFAQRLVVHQPVPPVVHRVVPLVLRVDALAAFVVFK